VNFEDIKNDERTFAQFAEIINMGADFLNRIRDTTNNLWVVRAAVVNLLIVNNRTLLKNGATEEQIKKFDETLNDFVEELNDEIQSRMQFKYGQTEGNKDETTV